MLMLMDVPEQTAVELAKDFCAFFHQESVMVTFSPSSVVFYKGDDLIIQSVPGHAETVVSMTRSQKNRSSGSAWDDSTKTV